MPPSLRCKYSRRPNNSKNVRPPRCCSCPPRSGHRHMEMTLALVLLSFLLLCLESESRSLPYVSTVTPPTGPEGGGYPVSIIGRNLGFLDLDCLIMFGDAVGVKPTVVDAWDKIEVIAPVCKNCGEIQIQAVCGGKKSNKVPFTFQNECYGPTPGSELTKIPSLYSARENCTVCMDLVHLTMSAAPDQASYQALQFAMSDACYSPHFKQWTAPGTKCNRNYKDACKLLLGTIQDDLVDYMWELWDTKDGYWNGGLPNKVCQRVKKCNPNDLWT